MRLCWFLATWPTHSADSQGSPLKCDSATLLAQLVLHTQQTRKVVPIAGKTTRDGPTQVQSIRPCATWHLQAMPLHVSHSDTREGCYYMFHVLTPLEGVTTHLRPNER